MAWTRRDFVKQAAAASLAAPFAAAAAEQLAATASASPAARPNPATLPATTPDGAVNVRWLDGDAPAFFAGATWGVPWPKGTVPADARFAVESDAGAAVPAQTWPLATWPDGSLKWTAHAIGAQATVPASLAVRVRPTGPSRPAVARPPATSRAAGSDPAGAGVSDPVDGAPTSRAASATKPTPVGSDQGPRVTIKNVDGAYEVHTGPMAVRLAGLGKTLFRSIRHGDREVAVDGRLVCLRQDGPSDGDAPIAREAFDGDVYEIAVEQEGPVRAVFRLTGWHVAAGADGRKWLPFCVRLYFYAGSDVVRVMHTFIFDGDENKDFLAGLGVRFGVPMRDQLHDRHVRFASADGGLWGEAVRGVTGLRRDPGKRVRDAQVKGEPTPPLSDWDRAVRDRIELVPAWGDHTLAQLSADGFEIRKRTKPGHGWIRSDAGTRAAGVGYVGGISGGVAFGLRDFWQRTPTQLDVRGSHTDKAEVTLWLYSPAAPAMDLRFYHDGMGMTTHPEEIEGLNITYEDYEAGFGTPHGVARSSELFLWATPATPPRQRTIDFARSVTMPPVLACAPAHLASTRIFGGLFALPDRSSPVAAAIEDANDFLLGYYQRQQEDRRWYGFWDYGDVMHTYDADRHQWRYDVGGFAWDNSELSPDLWLWYSFLRGGDARVFRFAEAMTRHTGEVDVYHLGRFKGLGSRHNVMHWGCSAKQLRISTAIYRRFYYFLTADERVGDLLRDLVDADQTFTALDPIRKIRKEKYEPQPHALAVGFGTDFSALASAWLTEYERTGDEKLKQKLLNSMRTIGSMPFGFFTSGALYDPATGLFSLTGDAAAKPTAGLSHLSAVFGLQEICAELIETFDVPEFEKAWLQYCTLYSAPDDVRAAALGGFHTRENTLTSAHSRLTAYAARQTNDAKLKQRAWKEFVSDDRRWAPKRYTGELVRVKGPDVLKPIDEAAWVSTNDASQWGLAAIQNLALIGDAIPS